MTLISPRKRTNMIYGAIIGGVVGVAVFAATFSANGNWIYLMFIPIAVAMGLATQYVKDEDRED